MQETVDLSILLPENANNTLLEQGIAQLQEYQAMRQLYNGAIREITTKLENLLLIGYSPAQVALPYHLLAIGLNVASLMAAIGCVAALRAAYMDGLQQLYAAPETCGLLPSLLTGGILLLLVAVLNVSIIRGKILKINRLK